MKHTTSHILFLILAISVTILVGAIYWYMSYAINVSISRAAMARSAIDTDLSNKNRQQTFLNTYNDTAADRARLSGFFIPANRVVTFIEVVENLSQQSGAKVSLVSVNADNLDGLPSGTQGIVRASVSAIGSWSSVMRALKLAESLPYKISVSNVNLATSGGGSSSTKAETRIWSVNFDLVVATMVMTASSTTAVNSGQ